MKFRREAPPRVARCRWLVNDLQCILPRGHDEGQSYGAHPTDPANPGTTGPGRNSNKIAMPDPVAYALGIAQGRHAQRCEMVGSWMIPWGGDASPPQGTLVPWFGETDKPCPWGEAWEFCDGRKATAWNCTGRLMPDLRGWLGAPNWVQCVNGQTVVTGWGEVGSLEPPTGSAT